MPYLEMTSMICETFLDAVQLSLAVVVVSNVLHFVGFRMSQRDECENPSDVDRDV